MALIGKDSLEDKVRMKLIRDAVGKHETDQKKKNQEKADKATAKAEEKAQKAEDKAEWKQVRSKWKSLKDEAVKKIADRMMQTFEDWNKKKKQMVDSKATPEEMDNTFKQMKDAESSDIDGIIKGYSSDITEYVEKAKELKPKLGAHLSYDNQVSNIMTEANDDFQKRVKLQMKAAQKLAKLKSSLQLKQFDTDKINQALANIPLKVEEKIDEIKKILETLLGKIITPIYQPNMPEFNLDAVLALIKAFLAPVLSTTQPLTAIVGKIPIIGELAGIMGLILSGSGQKTTMTKEQLMKLIPKLPDLPTELMDKLMKIKDDLIMFCMTLPTILIQVIFEMINVIYSKLQIITSVIPLGNFFPLSLIGAAITATPKILALIKVLPGLMYDAILGMLKEKFAEAMALSFPTPNIDLESLVALTEDIEEQNATKKAKAKKIRGFKDVTKEIYESSLRDKGYTLMQAKTVQSNYQKIYNGVKDIPPLEITEFVDNGLEQVLDGDGQKTEDGFTETSIKRTPSSLEDYESYFKSLIGESNLDEGLKYEKIKETKSVIGEWYDTYRKEFKKYGHDVVLKEEMEPSPLLKK